MKLWDAYLRMTYKIYGPREKTYHNIAKQKVKRPEMINHKVPTHLSKDKKKKIFKIRSKCK